MTNEHKAAPTVAAAGLTDKRIADLWRHSTVVGGDLTSEYVRHFARAVERAVLASLAPAGLEVDDEH